LHIGNNDILMFQQLTLCTMKDDIVRFDIDSHKKSIYHTS
jgi:hypothetical protein